MKRKNVCGKCGINPRRPTHAYCLSCHAKEMREYRKTHPLTKEQRIKDACRSYAYVYFKRRKISKTSCEKCGNINSQMHHPDYSKPLCVNWLCRECHLAIHKMVNP